MAQHVLPGPLIKILEDPPSREYAVPTCLALKRILIKRTVYRNYPLRHASENNAKVTLPTSGEDSSEIVPG